MSIYLYHQAGHNTIWNSDSFIKDKVGDGLIYSPVHESSEKINHVKANIKSHSLFDPQFYLPNSQKKQFLSYDFFPSTILEEGFSTIDFQAVASESAKRCIDFQIAQDFSKIIIPTRFFEQLDSRYSEYQDELFVRPFIRYLNKVKPNKDIILTVPLTKHMIKSTDYKESILNWLTSYPEINGIYFVCHHDSKTKQITDEQFLLEYIQIIKIASEADLQVLIGYSNTESILYSLCAEDIALTIGAFENTRIFSLDRFIVNEETDIRQAPAARIYMPKLLNWIRFEEASFIKQNFPEIWSQIYTPNQYSEEAFTKVKPPAFNNSLLYKHYFIEFSKQIQELSPKNIAERFSSIESWIKNAQFFYELLDGKYILEKNSNNQHLITWQNVLLSLKAKDF